MVHPVNGPPCLVIFMDSSRREKNYDISFWCDENSIELSLVSLE